MPTLRHEQFYDLQSLISKAVRDIVKYKDAYQNCLNCEHFIEQTEICKLANARPPARIIVYGCPKHCDKEQVPF